MSIGVYGNGMQLGFRKCIQKMYSVYSYNKMRGKFQNQFQLESILIPFLLFISLLTHSQCKLSLENFLASSPSSSQHHHHRFLRLCVVFSREALSPIQTENGFSFCSCRTLNRLLSFGSSRKSAVRKQLKWRWNAFLLGREPRPAFFSKAGRGAYP